MRFIFAIMIIAAGFPLLACDQGGDNRLLQREPGISCIERKPGGAPSFLDRKISVAYRESKLGNIVRDLQVVQKIPISYIGRHSEKPINIRLDQVSVASLLQAVLARDPESACRIVGDHVMIYPDLPNFKAVVRGVDIVDRPRGAAARRYIDFAKGQVPYFSDVDVLLGGVIELPLFDERVSLSSKATVLDHLVQILGNNKSAFFTIRNSPAGGLVFSLGSV